MGVILRGAQACVIELVDLALVWLTRGGTMQELHFKPMTDEALAVETMRGSTRRAKIALAWHDITCPEGDECRDRPLHAASMPLTNGGLIERFIERCKELEVEL